MPRKPKQRVWHWNAAGPDIEPGHTAFIVTGVGDFLTDAYDVAKFLERCLANRELIEGALRVYNKARRAKKSPQLVDGTCDAGYPVTADEPCAKCGAQSGDDCREA